MNNSIPDSSQHATEYTCAQKKYTDSRTHTSAITGVINSSNIHKVSVNQCIHIEPYQATPSNHMLTACSVSWVDGAIVQASPDPVILCKGWHLAVFFEHQTIEIVNMVGGPVQAQAVPQLQLPQVDLNSGRSIVCFFFLKYRNLPPRKHLLELLLYVTKLNLWVHPSPSHYGVCHTRYKIPSTRKLRKC